jgi:hypothetical protein
MSTIRSGVGGPELMDWGFKTAVISAFPSLERKGRYEIFTFTRGAGGQWTVTRPSAKVFANDV